MSDSKIALDTTQATIDDFGAQWSRFRENNDYYGSTELLQDIFGPLLKLNDIVGRRTAEIGSGSGRIVLMLLHSGAAHVTAVEPSEAITVLQENTRQFADRITYVRARGEEIPLDAAFDYIFSIGVLHHIPDPAPVVSAAFRALKPGGKMLIWVYGREGNEAYLFWALPLRRLTRRLPDAVLAVFSSGLNIFLGLYVWLCRWLPLPMRSYMKNHIGKLSWEDRYLTIFDQLNPTEARYYYEKDARALLSDAGFRDIANFQRHGYSWTVLGVKPNQFLNRDTGPGDPPSDL